MQAPTSRKRPPVPDQRRAALEVCVDTPAGVVLGADPNIDRVELCSALDVGGLTPSAGLLDLSRAIADKVHAMIRPRSGGFVYSPQEIDLMCRDIQAVRRAGLAGVVVGAADGTGHLDLPVLKTFVDEAGDLDVTLHRVVDTLDDPLSAVDIAKELGVRRILSSGGAVHAAEGVACLAQMQAQAEGAVEIMAGSGITPLSIGPIAAATGLRDFHGSFAVKSPSHGSDPMGFGTGAGRAPDPGLVAKARAVLDQL